MSAAEGMIEKSFCYRCIWEGDSRGGTTRMGSFEEVGMRIQGSAMPPH